MMSHALFCGMILCHGLLVSGAEIKKRSLHIMKDPQEFEYVLKRSRENAVNDQDSKERRSNVGSSFIRFGRSEKSNLYDVDQSKDYTMDQPQTRSDIIIRYGRAEKKARPQKKNSQIIRFGRSDSPVELDLTLICEDILMNEESHGRVLHYPSHLSQICNDLGYKRVEYNDERLDLKQE